MTTFDFLFGCLLGKFILKQTINLSKTLQSSKLSAAEGQESCEDVITTLGKDRNENRSICFGKGLNNAGNSYLSNQPDCQDNEKHRISLALKPIQIPNANFQQSRINIANITTTLMTTPSKV